MTRNKSIRFPPGAVFSLMALAAAGCGGDDNGNGGGTTAANESSTASGGGATIAAQSEGDLGMILVDSNGRTIYLFEKDSGTKSSCFGGCASAWPPVRASGKPTTGGGLTASLGTTPRSDGAAQVTYNGHPLYLFAGDQAAGDTTGQGLTEFGGSWFALNTAGDPVTTKPSTTSSSGGGVPGY